MSDKILPVARVVHHTHENICYDWVSADVLDYPSDYLTQEFIKRFRDDYDLSNPSVPRRGFLLPFVQSYKKFKGGFFRVRGSDDFPNLLIGTDGSPLFPLYWTEKPTRIVGLSVADLNVKARSEVEFLKGLKKKSIGCFDVIDAEGDPGEMAPKRPMSAKDLRSFYGLGQKKGATSSGTQSHTDQIPINVDPNTPASSIDPADPAQKRPRLEDNSETTSDQTHPIQTSTDADPSSLTIRPSLDKWWLNFQVFESPESEEVSSIFDHRFPIRALVEEKLCNPVDRGRVQRAGLYNTTLMAQSLAARTAFLAHGLSHGISALEKEKIELQRENGVLHQKIKLLNNSEKIIRELTQKISALEIEAAKVPILSKEKNDLATRLETLRVNHKKIAEEKDQISSSLTYVQAEKEKLSSDFDKARQEWQNEEKELKTDMALYHGTCFEKALSQVQLLYPDLDLSRTGMFKEIVDGHVLYFSSCCERMPSFGHSRDFLVITFSL
ncbi:hypothetical protein SESBI_28813 [Sesbania bispinosa]|nr:hypothetical protein SESBI_28813 [Sesbania bispinosa]